MVHQNTGFFGIRYFFIQVADLVYHQTLVCISSTKVYLITLLSAIWCKERSDGITSLRVLNKRFCCILTFVEFNDTIGVVEILPRGTQKRWRLLLSLLKGVFTPFKFKRKEWCPWTFQSHLVIAVITYTELFALLMLIVAIITLVTDIYNKR